MRIGYKITGLVDLKIIGLIENMAGFVCPKCTKESEIFRKSAGGVEEFCRNNDVPYLGALPIDPKICQAMDTGENPVEIDSGNIILTSASGTYMYQAGRC